MNTSANFELELFVRQKLSIFVELDDDDWAALWREVRIEQNVEAGTEIYSLGDKVSNLGILAKGWAYRYKLLSDGRRQILGFMMPGDSFGTGSALFNVSSHSAATLTDCLICRFPAEDFATLLCRRPEMGFALLWATMRDNAINLEHITRLGRLTALERVGHLLLELLARLQLVNLAGEGDYHLPLTQETLSDALGLSKVHVNRTLRRLREQGFIEIHPQRHWIVIRDPDGLAEISEFDSGYLDQDTAPAEDLAAAIHSLGRELSAE